MAGLPFTRASFRARPICRIRRQPGSPATSCVAIACASSPQPRFIEDRRKRMPPVFETAPAAQPSPSPRRSTQRHWIRSGAGLSAEGPAIRAGQWLYAQNTRKLPILPPPDARAPQVSCGLKTKSQIPRPVRPAACRPLSGRRLIVRQCAARPRSRRAALRSALSLSSRYRKADARGPADAAGWRRRRQLTRMAEAVALPAERSSTTHRDDMARSNS